MRVARITGVREGGIVEVPDPRIAANFVKIRVVVTPMCTEYKAYRDGRQTQHLGHEFAGEVVEVAQPGKVKPGDRVLCVQYAGVEYKDGDVELRIMNDEDLLCIIG